jgi:lambda family phage portal protein
MKRTILDKIIGFFSPDFELKRINSRINAELMLRSYDAASNFSTDDWQSATKGSSNTEIRGAQDTLRAKGSDAVRNNAYGARAVMAIANNVVGSGILPHIKGKSKGHTKKLMDAWKEWGETTLCDSVGRNNFYGLQLLAMRGIAERGEVLALKTIDRDGPHIQLLESDYLVSHLDQGYSGLIKETSGVIQGVRFDESGKIISYFIYNSHPGDNIASIGYREVPVSEISHVYREDRPGQLRGVSWFAPVQRLLEDLAEYQQATLIGRKVGACFAMYITTNETDQVLSRSQLLAKRQTENSVTPGSVRYLANGETITQATPPKADGYSEYVNQMLRAIASGIGISYESLTSDYSQVNYSSGRMAHLEFKKNVESWRENLLIPKFCNPMFEHFLKWCVLVKGISVDGVSVDWISPSWTMLDPNKEYSAVKDAMRAGLISYQKAVRELGYQPEDMLLEIAEHNKSLDESEIILDSDPRKTTVAGLFQIDPATQNNGAPSSEPNNKKVPSKGIPQKSN